VLSNSLYTFVAGFEKRGILHLLNKIRKRVKNEPRLQGGIPKFSADNENGADAKTAAKYCD